MSAVGYEDDPAIEPEAELRTSLALATLGAALIHVMSAFHGEAGAPVLAMAGLQLLLAAALALTRAQWLGGPSLGLNVTLALSWIVGRATGLPLDLGGTIAAVTELVAGACALAMLVSASERAMRTCSKLAFAAFAAGAFSGFGHFGH